MQVSGKLEADVAVVSNNPAQEFMIANTPDFFNILSGSLYSNPVLAICRETICNAWDANEVNGKGSIPIEITLAEGELMVMDDGPGIPDDKIVEIYGTYGLSTKQNLSNQTGGFGLGCKSPFAYSDNFEVTSIHEGVKTVYQMTKASDETDGKPAINKIYSIRTDEPSGLTVKMPVREDDMDKFINAISRVCASSEKPALFNGREVKHLPPFRNFIFTSNFGLPFRYQHLIYIKYGEVLYPLDQSPVSAFYDIYSKLKDFVDAFNNSCAERIVLILKAPANSLSVTPSRESLRYTETVQKTIKTLLNKTYEYLHSHVKEKTRKAVNEWCASYYPKWIKESSDWENIAQGALYFNSKEDYYTEDTVFNNFYAFLNSRQKECAFREYCLSTSPFKNSILKAYKKDWPSLEKYQSPFKWFKKHYLNQLQKKFEANNLSLSKLFYKRPYCNTIATFTADGQFPKLRWRHVFYFMVPTIFIGTRVGKTYAGGVDIPKYHAFYKCTAKNIDSVERALTNLGFMVNRVDAPATATPAVAENTVLNLQSLNDYSRQSYIWETDIVNGYHEYTLAQLEEGCSILTTAKAVFVWNYKTQNSGVDSRMLNRLAKVMGKEVVIAKCQKDMKILQKKFNLVPLQDYLIEKTKQYFNKKVKWSPTKDELLLTYKYEEREAVRNFLNLVEKEKHDFGYKFLSESGTSKDYHLYHSLNTALELNLTQKVYVDKTYLKFRKDWTQNLLRFCPYAEIPGLLMFVRNILLKRKH